MYYEVHGEGPPLLLLHGGTGSIPAKWIPYFSSQFRVIAMEPMGHGRTAYARLSPDGADHWPIVLGRLQRMWPVEPDFTREEIQRIKAPTLIIVGDGDIVTPEHAVEMFRTIPGAQLCVVPPASHGVMPKETVLTFLNEAHADEK